MSIWLWKHLLTPMITGIFFAFGHFLIYYLSKTKWLKSLESYLFVS